MSKRILIIIACIIMTAGERVAAQSGQDLEQVMQVMKELHAYYNAKPVSFNMYYTYSNEHTPGKILDSLQGKMELAGIPYHYMMGNTETIHNAKYTVILFKEDKLMYVTRSDSAASPADPLLPVKGSLEKTGIAHCKITRTGSNKTVQISFREGAPYRQMELTLDTISGHLLSMQYIVRTTMLMDAQDAKPEAGYDEYAVVRAVLSDYKPLPADNSRFDEKNFFSREGNELIVTPAYKGYKIFVGSPNL